MRLETSEDIRSPVGKIAAAGDPGAIPAHAQFTEPTGSETLVIAEVENREISVLTRNSKRYRFSILNLFRLYKYNSKRKPA